MTLPRSSRALTADALAIARPIHQEGLADSLTSVFYRLPVEAVASKPLRIIGRARIAPVNWGPLASALRPSLVRHTDGAPDCAPNWRGFRVMESSRKCKARS